MTVETAVAGLAAAKSTVRMRLMALFPAGKRKFGKRQKTVAVMSNAPFASDPELTLATVGHADQDQLFQQIV